MVCTKIIYNMAKMSMILFMYSKHFISKRQIFISRKYYIYSNNLTNREYLTILTEKLHSLANIWFYNFCCCVAFSFRKTSFKPKSFGVTDSEYLFWMKKKRSRKNSANKYTAVVYYRQYILKFVVSFNLGIFIHCF